MLTKLHSTEMYPKALDIAFKIWIGGNMGVTAKVSGTVMDVCTY